MLKSISLSNFRNFSKKEISFSPQVNVIVGSNASGKTNLLEAIYMLSTGKSFKAKLEEEIININSEVARIAGVLSIKNDELCKLEIVLGKGEWSRKKLLLNGVGKRLVDFAGNLKVVLFGPWDMDLVTSSPSTRRKFLDAVLSQVDHEYRRSLLSYEKGLRQRNRLLFRIREENIPRSQLLFWDKLLIKNGDYISAKREEFIDFVNATSQIEEKKFAVVYDKSAISESRLEHYANAEIASATTLVGPHRDDLIFKKGEQNLASFGSRGEQRMAILWVKLAELLFIKEKTGENPTVLLDDIFSELDHEHRDLVWQIAKNQQTIITTADPHFVIDSPEIKRLEC